MKDAIIPYNIIETFGQLSNIYEIRLMNWVIAKAQCVLKMCDKNLDQINLQYAFDQSIMRVTLPARYLLDKGSTNYHCISKAFSLADKRITYEKNDIYYHLHIIAFPEFRKDGKNKLVTFVMHREIWHSLLDFVKGYRLISLPTIMALQSTYSVVMYLLCSQQSRPITYSITRLRELTNTMDKKAYSRNSNFFAKVLDVAKAELDKKAPYSFDYTADRTGKGGAYHYVTIVPKSTHNAPHQDTDREDMLERQRVRLHENVADYLTLNFGFTTQELESIEGVVTRLGDWQEQLLRIAELRTVVRARQIDNPKAYVVGALKRMA